MAFRARHWSNSAFAKWFARTFASTEMPVSGTIEEWAQWEKDYKGQNAFVYWFTETFLDKLQNAFMLPVDKFDDIRVYCRNRFVTKTHYARTNLKPGKWHETETRLLHSSFELLVDFIEVEKASQGLWNNPDKRPWWKKISLTNWGEFRSRELGLQYLEWEMSLKFDEDMGVESGDELYALPTPQAESAYEQKLLYIWWKDIRPARPDPYDASGYNTYFDHMREKAAASGIDEMTALFGGEHTPEEDEMQRIASKTCDEIEKQYEDEDTRMLKKLIDIRRHLWT